MALPDGGATIVRDLVHRRGECSFQVDWRLGAQEVRFWGDVPAPPSPAVEPAFAATLLPAMTAGGRLELPIALSPRLRLSTEDLQAALAAIAAAGPYAPTPLQAVELRAPEAPAERVGTPADGVGLFFSGGVDSWATLLRRPDVTDLIYVHGFDVPIERPDLSAVIEARLREAAASQKLPLHVVRTDMRILHDRAVGWEIGHGPALAAVAHLLSPICGEVVIGSGVTYAEPIRRGSHPIVDHLWGAERCRIVNDGSHLTRAEKVELVASSPRALETLRVCWAWVDEYNCGRCEKCLRTMAALEAVGALERCPTFEAPLDLDAIAQLTLPSSEVVDWWDDNLRLARRHGNRPLAEALARCLSSNRVRLRPAGELRLAAAESRAEELARRLEALVGSRSWRIAAPLRRTASAARRLSPRRGGG